MAFRNPLTTGATLADGSVTSAKLALNLQSDTYDGGVVAVDPGTVGWRIERDTGDASFQNVTIRGTLNASDLVAGTLNVARIAALSIVGGKLANTTITGAKLVLNTVTGDRIADTTITGGKIALSTITGNRIANTTITGGKIALTTITGDRISNTTITGGKIATNTITADKLSVTSLDAITATMGTLSVNGPLTMTGSGMFRTAAIGSDRIEVANANANDIFFYRGNSLDAQVGLGATNFTISAGATGDKLILSADVRIEAIDQMALISGTAASPSIVFAVDLDSGFYRVSSGIAGYSSNGTNAVQFGSASATVAGIAITSTVDQSILLKFNTPRGWQFMQDGTGASTALVLKALAGGKAFHIREVVGGTDVFTVIASSVLGTAQVRAPLGNVSGPGYAYQGRTNLGWYSPVANQLAMSVAGVQEMLMGTTGFNVPNVYNAIGGATANVVVSSGGPLKRISSARAYKEDIKPARRSGVLKLTPVTFWPKIGNPTRGLTLRRMKRSEGGRQYFGLEYEDVAANFRAAKWDKDMIDWNAIIVGLLQELKEIRREVDELKAAA